MPFPCVLWKVGAINLLGAGCECLPIEEICRDVRIRRSWITFRRCAWTWPGTVLAHSWRCHWHKRRSSYGMFSFAVVPEPSWTRCQSLDSWTKIILACRETESQEPYRKYAKTTRSSKINHLFTLREQVTSLPGRNMKDSETFSITPRQALHHASDNRCIALYLGEKR